MPNVVKLTLGPAHRMSCGYFAQTTGCQKESMAKKNECLSKLQFSQQRVLQKFPSCVLHIMSPRMVARLLVQLPPVANPLPQQGRSVAPVEHPKRHGTHVAASFVWRPIGPQGSRCFKTSQIKKGVRLDHIFRTNTTNTISVFFSKGFVLLSFVFENPPSNPLNKKEKEIGDHNFKPSINMFVCPIQRDSPWARQVLAHYVSP